ncbi:glutaminyl-peptide cyclotransferase-like isoform X2 [Phragmites australis]|uniref:glutaminyl-peptide cyclotransferase-like isoform X2 n=1 Tax=Phragmites australis TaxID=29695 RepID=UPI002D78903A|nr:glutaminyl-peptide cyclotransferase-like isoform X2 [Phragmites australis]
MPAGSRRRPPPPHLRRAMPPASFSVSAPTATPPPPLPPPLYLRRPVIAAAAALAALLLFATTYAPWRAGYPPPALLSRAAVATRFYSFDLVREYPHDPDAFTQGLLYGGNGILFESTGLHHRSSVRKVELRTGKVLDHHQMDGNMFGEGLTLVGNRLFQVTWLKNDGFIYDRHNFSKRESFTHKMSDGWGLATDGKVLFGSDGTSKLYQLDPKSFEVMKMATVKYQGNEVPYLNELEYIDGEVWANVWQTDCIARISPEDGLVVGWIFLHELRRHLWNSGNTLCRGNRM